MTRKQLLVTFLSALAFVSAVLILSNLRFVEDLDGDGIPDGIEDPIVISSDGVCAHESVLPWGDDAVLFYTGSWEVGNEARKVIRASGMWHCVWLLAEQSPMIRGNFHRSSCNDPDDPDYASFDCWADLTRDETATKGEDGTYTISFEVVDSKIVSAEPALPDPCGLDSVDCPGE